jgi:putative transcriptional regulator
VARGVFFVAQPSLNDGLFCRSVVLITQRSASPAIGPAGVIINKPTAMSLACVLPQHPRIAALSIPIHAAGPVARQSLVFLLRTIEASPRDIRVLDDVFITADADWVESALDEEKGPIEVRVYGGYSGWAPGQLQRALDREDWYLLPASADAIFGDGGPQRWQDLVKRALLRSTTLGGNPTGETNVTGAGLAVLMGTR